ncbi:MAG TPA: signal peptidase I [Baekduia sp.]|nr:signal peptidase I [Baekduia sp.]
MSALRAARQNTVVETILFLVLAAAVVILAQAFVVKPYRIPSGSMEPTLHVGDRVLVNRFSHRVLGQDVQVGDVVVFHPPAGADASPPVCGAQDQGATTASPCGKPTPERSSATFIKRVVAVGGDRIALRGGHVIRNGQPVKEPYIRPCGSGAECDFPEAITVPTGMVFLLGDNRGNSDDSRFWGPVPESWVIGTAFVLYWPPSRIGHSVG